MKSATYWRNFAIICIVGPFVAIALAIGLMQLGGYWDWVAAGLIGMSGGSLITVMLHINDFVEMLRGK